MSTEKKNWLLMPVSSRTTNRELTMLLEETPEKYRAAAGAGAFIPRRKEALLNALNAARAAYRDEQASKPAPAEQPERVATGGKPRARRKAQKSESKSLCAIPAREVNEWLRSLPQNGEE